MLQQKNFENSAGDSSRGTMSLLQSAEQELVQQGIMEALQGNESEDRLIITKLVKKYGQKRAVDNLSLTLFKNEILVLLGHNGAGKTTTINMLTGLEKPTSGSAIALDVNLFEDYGGIVDLIGVCPQEDVLIDRLTVRENLSFFCQFKGIENED